MTEQLTLMVLYTHYIKHSHAQAHIDKRVCAHMYIKHRRFWIVGVHNGKSLETLLQRNHCSLD